MAAIGPDRARAVLAEYERALAGAPLAPQSRRAYRSRVAGYLRWLTTATATGDPLSDAGARDRAVARYRTYLATVHSARPTTVNAVLTALDHFHLHLRLGKAALPREEVPASVRRALPLDAQHRLLRAADELPARDRAIAYTLLYTGVRVSELVALDVPDLRPVDRPDRLVVPARASGSGRAAGEGHRAGPREIPLHRAPRPALRAWLAERRRWSAADRVPALFLNRRGGRLSTRWVDDLIARLGERAEVADHGRPHLTPQTLRHTFGTRLAGAGADPVLVASLMGHRRLDSVHRYLDEAGRFRPGRDVDARAALRRAYT